MCGFWWADPGARRALRWNRRRTVGGGLKPPPTRVRNVWNNMALNIIWLDDSASGKRELVGGKAANLNQLHSGGQVPLGFCITTDAAARVVPVCSGEASLPPDLYAEIETAYAELGARCGTSEPAVAIRSSAVAEDGAVNSFAGQYQTLLNVAGMDAVAAAIVECVEAAYQPHAVAYRKRSGAGADEVKLAILVQEFIAADSSAVAFTCQPGHQRPERDRHQRILGVGRRAGRWQFGSRHVHRGQTGIADQDAERGQERADVCCWICWHDRNRRASRQSFAANLNRRTGRRGLP